MLEHAVEAHLLAQCRRVGLLCLKLTSPARAGVPDRVVIAPEATVFVEVKRPGGRLRRLQEVTVAKMRRAGAVVHVVDTLAGVDELVAGLARPSGHAPVDTDSGGGRARQSGSGINVMDRSDEEVKR